MAYDKWGAHLCKEDFERKKPFALAYIHATFKPTKTTWRYCYDLKQAMTKEVGYFFAEDMSKYFALAGYETRRNFRGEQEVRATYLRRDREPPAEFRTGVTRCLGHTRATSENP